MQKHHLKAHPDKYFGAQMVKSDAQMGMIATWTDTLFLPFLSFVILYMYGTWVCRDGFDQCSDPSYWHPDRCMGLLGDFMLSSNHVFNQCSCMC